MALNHLPDCDGGARRYDPRDDFIPGVTAMADADPVRLTIRLSATDHVAVTVLWPRLAKLLRQLIFFQSPLEKPAIVTYP